MGLVPIKVQAASSAGPVSHPDAKADVARRAWKIRRLIYDLQNCVSAIERCEKRKCRFRLFDSMSMHLIRLHRWVRLIGLCIAVIALCHGVAYGAAIDIVTAADIRYCTKSTKFSIKEVDIGLAADVGTLSRLPKIGVSYSWAKEATYTARIFGGEEAGRVGFVSRVFEDKQALLIEGLELASLIATKSPVAVLSSKAIMDYSRDRSVEDGLKFTASWNAAMVQADDVNKATMGALRKTKTTFQKL